MKNSVFRAKVEEPLGSFLLWILILISTANLIWIFVTSSKSFYEIILYSILLIFAIVLSAFLFFIVYRYFDTRSNNVEILVQNNKLYLPMYYLPKASLRKKLVEFDFTRIISCDIENVVHSGTWTIPRLRIRIKDLNKDILLSSLIFVNDEDFKLLNKKINETNNC